MILHREVATDWHAFKLAEKLDDMGHTIVAITVEKPIPNPHLGMIGNPQDRWHVWSQGPDIDTHALDKGDEKAGGE